MKQGIFRLHCCARGWSECDHSLYLTAKVTVYVLTLRSGKEAGNTSLTCKDSAFFFILTACCFHCDLAKVNVVSFYFIAAHTSSCVPSWCSSGVHVEVVCV